MYDAVVVGAGAAGCVVARRLADTGRQILLLEAGPDLRSRMPADFRNGWQFPRRHEWGYESAPDERGEVLPLRRGKLVGGTSWVTRFGVRGSPADFDRWTELGCTGWDFDDVLPWFRRVETDLDWPEAPWHGDSGPIPVTRYMDHPDSELTAALQEACAAGGIPLIDDHNRPGAVGVARMPMTGRNGDRVTTADAYLPPGAEPASLTVRADTMAAAIAIERGRAVGVRLPDGRLIEAGWVVVCAGVYGSPTLLMRSGIGPADHLRRVGVPVLIDLPCVGENLADHPAVSIDSGYRRTGVGQAQLHTLATFRSSHARADQPPDLSFWVADPSGDPAESEIDILLLTPASRGAVRLRSANPADPPLIRLPCLDGDRDVERLAEGLLRARQLRSHRAMHRVCEAVPPPEDQTAADVRNWIRHERYSIPHTVGTCAMGDSSDLTAVVDRLGGVLCVDGVSIIDASIIPAPPSGFPHLLTIMLAERLAAELLARL